MAKVNEWLDDGKRSSDTIPLAVASLMEHDCRRVYDAGCGNGELLIQFRRAMTDMATVCSLYGSDIEPDHAQIAFDRMFCDPDMPMSCAWSIVCADASTYRPVLTDNSLDGIVALNWL